MSLEDFQNKNMIAVARCKGGVGKSTTSVNLAYALHELGCKVGLFDADVYGPSLPTMVYQNNAELLIGDDNKILPINAGGVKLMSFGYSEQSEDAAIMRGPMVSQVINQLFTQTDWGELDYLIIDMPPGTGDVQLTLGQMIPITASVMVTTPQKVSFIDVLKGIKMFDQLNVPTIAAIQNMTYFKCDNCDEKHYIFGVGALQKLTKEFGFKLTYEFPMDPQIPLLCDTGIPIVVDMPEHDVSKLYLKFAKELLKEVEVLKKQSPPQFQFIENKGIQMLQNNEVTIISPKTLRENCICAHCVDDVSGQKKLDPATISEDIKPEVMNPVGNYALGISWSDGHSSLYPYTSILGHK